VEYQPACDRGECPPGSQERLDSLTTDARSASTAAAVSFIAGGVLVAGGLTLVFTAPRSRSPNVTAVPVVGPGFQGLMLTGRTW
jgi:hypothetical protein